MKLPVDFVALAKAPAAVRGYPHSVSAADLMKNFTACILEVDGQPVAGLRLVVTTRADGSRSVKLDGNVDGMPSGSEGDMLYHNGTEWVVLPAPSFSGIPMLSFSGGAPTWVELDEQALSVCSGGTPTTINVLKQV